jgi:hypothetical protein
MKTVLIGMNGDGLRIVIMRDNNPKSEHIVFGTDHGCLSIWQSGSAATKSFPDAIDLRPISPSSSPRTQSREEPQ